MLGTNAAGQQVVAPERPIRTSGGWAQLGLPLSRIFNANPSGRNAGWSLYALYSVDQAKTRDLMRLGAAGNRRFSTMAVGTLNYSLNRWVTFTFEHSIYSTHANPQLPLPLFKGIPTRVWHDVREEFGPTFTFSSYLLQKNRRATANAVCPPGMFRLEHLLGSADIRGVHQRLPNPAAYSPALICTSAASELAYFLSMRLVIIWPTCTVRSM